jgi:hypothetical protein
MSKIVKPSRNHWYPEVREANKVISDSNKALRRDMKAEAALIKTVSVDEMNEFLAAEAMPFVTRTNKSDPLALMNHGARRYVTRNIEEPGSLFDSRD